MNPQQRIAQLLLETGAYKDLPEPVILTSGELGIYYINTEKLTQDQGEWEKYGNDAAALLAHASRLSREKPLFKEAIDIIANKAQQYLESVGPIAIAGGQRRDWLFSGPVAEILQIPHIALYKDGGMELKQPGKENTPTNSLNLFSVVHIVDLITEGSSIYNKKLAQAHGWVPMLRDAGAHISDLVAVVSRKQGGEQNLAAQGVLVHPFVTIDEKFLREYSTNPERAAAYFQNPTQWSKSYLAEHGADALVSTFDPNGGKIDRAKKFLTRYQTVLKENDKFEPLRQAVHERYSISLDVLMEGRCN